MEIKNRLFPYPVLCIENDDYEESDFNVECYLKEEASSFELVFSINLKNNDELAWLVREGYAEFVIHIECSSTAFRTILKTTGNSITYHISKSRVNNEISLLGAIVANKKIISFKSKHLNEDYRNENINFEHGAILAYYNMPKIFITKNYEELVGDNAFFTIIKRIKTDENEENPVIYDINDSKIKIYVDEVIFDEYIKISSNSIFDSISACLLIMPAIVFMIETLRNEDIEKYKNLYWYQNINKACKLQNINFLVDYINGEKTSIEIAQQLLQLPISKAFIGISRMIED